MRSTLGEGRGRAKKTAERLVNLVSQRGLTLTALWWVLCAARYVFLQRTLKPRGDRVGALGGQYGRRSTPRQLRCHRPTPRQLRV